MKRRQGVRKGRARAEAAGHRRPVEIIGRRRDYRLLLLSFGTSRAGDFLYTVALVAYVYDRTSSAAWVSAAALARFVPTILLSPAAGVAADRFERRAVMVTSDLTQLAAMVALLVVGALAGPAWAVVALSVLSATAGTLYQAAAPGMVRETVPEDELTAANALLSTVDTLAFVAGPAAGGLLMLIGEPPVAFGVNAATFAVSAMLLLRIRTRSRPTPRTEGPSILLDLYEGAVTLVGDRKVAVLTGCLMAASAVYGVELVALVLVSTELLATGTAGLGWLQAASGAGGVLGAAASARLAAAARPRMTIAVTVLLTGAPLAALAVIRPPVLAYLVLVVEGAALIALEVLVGTAMQRGVPPAVLGRVSGLVLSLTSAAVAAGALTAPLLVAGFGLRPALVLAGLLPVILATVALAMLPNVDTDAERARRVLGPRVAVLGRLRLLEDASPVALEGLAAAVVEERLPVGSVVLRQGDPADDLFILVEGTLTVERVGGQGVRHLADLTAPDHVGEIGLVHRAPRNATVATSSDAVLWRLPGSVFLDAVGAAPALSPVLAERINRRLAAAYAGDP